MAKDLIEVIALLLAIFIFAALFLYCIKPSERILFDDEIIKVTRLNRKLTVVDKTSDTEYDFTLKKTRFKEQQLKSLLQTDSFTLESIGKTLVIHEDNKTIRISFR